VKQVQRWLGHHSAAFTLDTYVHLLEDQLGEPLELLDELASQPEITASCQNSAARQRSA
jgi:integrase